MPRSSTARRALKHRRRARSSMKARKRTTRRAKAARVTRRVGGKGRGLGGTPGMYDKFDWQSGLCRSNFESSPDSGLDVTGGTGTASAGSSTVMPTRTPSSVHSTVASSSLDDTLRVEIKGQELGFEIIKTDDHNQPIIGKVTDPHTRWAGMAEGDIIVGINNELLEPEMSKEELLAMLQSTDRPFSLNVRKAKVRDDSASSSSSSNATVPPRSSDTKRAIISSNPGETAADNRETAADNRVTADEKKLDKLIKKKKKALVKRTTSLAFLQALKIDFSQYQEACRQVTLITQEMNKLWTIVMDPNNTWQERMDLTKKEHMDIGLFPITQKEIEKHKQYGGFLYNLPKKEKISLNDYSDGFDELDWAKFHRDDEIYKLYSHNEPPNLYLNTFSTAHKGCE